MSTINLGEIAEKLGFILDVRIIRYIMAVMIVAKFNSYPAGTNEAPAFHRLAVVDVPDPAENTDLYTRVDWGWARRTIDSGLAVGIAVDPSDTGPLIDAIQNRLGFNVAIRVTEPGVAYMYRPDAMEINRETD